MSETVNEVGEILDLVIAMDATASMGSEIEHAKNYTRSLIEMFQHHGDVRLCVTWYRDVCDRPRWYGSSGFTTDSKVAAEFTKTIYASGGGDAPEDVIGALDEISRLDWRPNARKVIVWIADAPPHGAEFGASRYGDSYPDYPVVKGGPIPKTVLGTLADMKVQIFGLHVRDDLTTTMEAFTKYCLTCHGQMLLSCDSWKAAFMITDQVDALLGKTMAVSEEDEKKYLLETESGPFTTAISVINENTTMDVLTPVLEKCWVASPVDTVRLVLFVRKRDGTIKRKNLGRRAWQWLMAKDQQSFRHLNTYVRDAGCVMDLLHFADVEVAENKQKTPFALKYLAGSLAKAYLALPECKDRGHATVRNCIDPNLIRQVSERTYMDVPPYFLAKWAPREKSKYDAYARQIAKLIFIDFRDARTHESVSDAMSAGGDVTALAMEFVAKKPRTNKKAMQLYRLMLSWLRRQAAPPVENLMCARQWELINLEKVTSGATQKYKKAFSRHIPSEVERVTKKGAIKATTLSGTSMVAHFVEHVLRQKVHEDEVQELEAAVVEAQWVDHFRKQSKQLRNTQFMVDLSGSMVLGEPMPLVTAIYIQLLLGNDRFLTTGNEWVEVKGETLEQKVRHLLNVRSPPGLPIADALSKALDADPELHTFFVLTDLRVSQWELNRIDRVREARNSKCVVVVLNLASDENKILIRRPKDLAEGIYVISGYSSSLLEVFSQGEATMEGYFLRMLRESFPLE